MTKVITEKVLDYLRNKLFVQQGKLSEDFVLIRGVWKVHCLFQPSIKERVFRYIFLVSQTVNQGCAYCMEDKYKDEFLQSLIGKSYFDLQVDDRCLDISLLDAIYSNFPTLASNTVTLKGDSTVKAIERARLVVDEGIRLLKDQNNMSKTQTVVNVGAVGHIVREMLNHGFKVFVTDLDPQLIGQIFFDSVIVHSGDKTLEFVANADLAIITGMALSTDTFDEILSTAKVHNTKVLVFAETGSSFAPVYLNFGVDCVVAEPFPFYIFQGTTVIKIYRKQNTNNFK